MALGYLISPALQVEDKDGKPLVGGEIVVFRHGTTTPYITWKNFNGDRNPARVALNALGMAVLLADDSQLYDVYCYDRNGVQQWSRLNVSATTGGEGGGGPGSDLSVLRCDAADLTQSGPFVFDTLSRQGEGAYVDAEGHIRLAQGTWHYDITVEVDYSPLVETGNTTNLVLYTTLNRACLDFDLSYAHTGTLQLSGIVNADDGTVLSVSMGGMSTGMTVSVADCGIFEVAGTSTGWEYYEAGAGIEIDGNIIAVDPDEVQGKLTAGEGIAIDENNVISVDGVENGFVTMSPVVAPPDGSGLFIQAGWGLRERVLDYKYYELPALQAAGSENAHTYIVAAPWKFRRQFEINTDTSTWNMDAVGFFLSANVPGGSSGLANCVVEWSVDKDHTAYLRSKTLLVPTYTSETPYVPCNAQGLKQGGYFFSFEVPSSAFVEKMLEDDRFEAGGDWSGYSGARGYMFFSLYNTVTHQYMSLPKTNGEKMAVEKIHNLQVDTTKVQPKLTAGSNITIVDNVISASVAPQVQADWAQSDSTAVDYIKNKPTVDQTYDASSTNAQSGVAVAEAIAEAENTFFAVYGVTTIGEVDTAYAQGKDLICRYNSHGHVYSSQLSSLVSGVYTFTTTDGFIDYEFTLSPDGGTGAWSIGSRAIPSGTQLVPSATTSDAGEVLTVDQNGDPTWAPAQAPISAGDGIDITNNVVSAKVDGTSVTFNANGELEATAAPLGLFEARYGQTTYAEIMDAINERKIVFCPGQGVDSVYRMATLTNFYDNPGSEYVEFEFYKSKTGTGVNDTVVIYRVDGNDNWTMDERDVKAGNISYPVTDVTVNGSSVVSSGVAAVTVPDQVNSDWDATSGAAEILNKPGQTNLVAGSNITIVDDAQNNTVTISAAATQAPVQDVTVGGVSVLNAQGVAEVPSIPVIGTVTL